MGTITALILTLPSGLEGAKVTRIRTLARYIDAANFPGGTNPYGTPQPDAEFPREIYYIDRKAAETRDVIEFELASAFDLAGVRAPRRQCVANLCQWTYRGAECTYTGTAYYNANDEAVNLASQDVCGKRLSSCELRFAQVRRQGSVTAGSNILTLTQPTAFSAGDPVTGFGIPAGTTVSSYSGAAVTMSAAATATTSVTTVTGTLQTNRNQIIVSSAAGIAVGMTVTGNYLPANTQVTAISGTTITLSSTADLTQFLTSAGTFTSSNVAGSNSFFSALIYNKNIYTPSSTAPALSVGQYVSSGLMPITEAATIASLGNYSSYRSIELSKYATTSLAGDSSVWTYYTVSSPSSATYSFSATNQTYTFGTDATLPFGSFPGVGTYSA